MSKFKLSPYNYKTPQINEALIGGRFQVSLLGGDAVLALIELAENESM